MSKRNLFYLKKFDNFYSDYRLIAISTGSTREEIDKGHLKIYLYERMLHLGLKSNGELRFSFKVPWTPQLLAQVFNLDPQLVEEAITQFEEYGLIEFPNDKSGTIILPDFPYMVASTSPEAKAEADRRAKNKTQQNLPAGYEEDLKDG